MKFCIIIPAHNEVDFIGKTLQSLSKQTLLPSEVIVVNDNSTDNTSSIIKDFTEKYAFIKSINIISSDQHMPGTKIINAFNKGLEAVKEEYDILCKFDADLIFPSEYLEKLSIHFDKDKKLGMAAGFCYIEENGNWKLENLTRKDHIRGALKAYRKECFKEMGGLKESIGWDTVDELLAIFHGWNLLTDPRLMVKHLKPTGQSYSKKSQYLQGEAFFKMRYGLLITTITAAKMAMKKKNSKVFQDYIQGYLKAKNGDIKPIVSEEEGRFIRSYRWKGIKEKFSR
ncbi:Glycosyl transferase family 2 [Flavobacteriaceae bacterium MAR_2010_188]|nr:Glycosyl transferase family 2 [Flavobacteriaceae bacterium MAR_2010_188]